MDDSTRAARVAAVRAVERKFKLGSAGASALRWAAGLHPNQRGRSGSWMWRFLGLDALEAYTTELRARVKARAGRQLTVKDAAARLAKAEREMRR
jgi:hypothetical protein